MGISETIAWADGGWLAHLSLFVLVASMVLRVGVWMRVGIMVSALCGLVFAIVVADDFGLAFWQAALFLVNAVQLGRTEWLNRNARFDECDEALRSAFLSGISRTHARHLIDQGNWVTGKPGEVLIQEDEAVSHLFFIFSGEAGVHLQGKKVGTCGPGDLVGDATALSGAPATGTVRLANSAYFWCISAPRFREYLDIHSDLRTAIERQINTSLEAKLRSANTGLAGNEGPDPSVVS